MPQAIDLYHFNARKLYLFISLEVLIETGRKLYFDELYKHVQWSELKLRKHVEHQSSKLQHFKWKYFVFVTEKFMNSTEMF